MRYDPILQPEKTVPFIETACPTVSLLFDELAKPEDRNKIPRDIPVVIVCETGNRNEMAIRFLSRYGYGNLVGLQFGMRGWIKADSPTKYTRGVH